MKENHFLIGLGGTGGKVLRSFRKAVYQVYKDDSPDGINLGYLYIDSDDSLMGLDDNTWKVLGKSVALPHISQLKISGLNLSDVLDNVTSYPGIAPWIGNRDYFRAIINSSSSANVLGGQKRRLGRFLFACRVGEYRARVQSIVKDLTVGNKTNVTFHFLLGLAGGTGSGGIIDAICQVRSMFPSPLDKIIIYALLPDKYPKLNHGGLNYHANGYAALLELNALDVGDYLPIDVSATQKERLKLEEAFNVCYLYTDENEDKNGVDIDTELPDIVSSFLFQKIINTKDWNSDAKSNSIDRLERYENVGYVPEVAPYSGEPERARRFSTFGTKQIAYPEDEILEFLIYTFARQAALQLQFNNFSESVGFVEQNANQAFNEKVRAPETLRQWLLADENLMLSEGILPDERASKQWKPIGKFWADITPRLAEFVRETYANDRPRWLAELQLVFLEQFEQHYRDLGVRHFYEIKRGEQRDYCREIRRVIELDLFGGWINGTRSLLDVSRLLEALINSLEDKSAALDLLITRNAEDEKQASALVRQHVGQWARLGVLSKWFGREINVFDAQAEALRRQFTLQTIGEGLRFARPLLDAVISEMTNLASEVARASTTVSSANRIFANAIAVRLSDAGQNNMQGQVVRFYDPEMVKDFAKSLVRNEQQQKMQTTEIRNAIAATLGDAQNFASLNSRITEQDFTDLLLRRSKENVIVAHDAVISADTTRDGVLTDSVLNRLEKQFGGNPDALRLFVSNIVSRAKCQLVFNNAEVTKTIPGKESPEPMIRYTTIIVPEFKDQGTFGETLVEEFNRAKTGPGEVVSNPQRPNEITLMNVASRFPARFVEDVKFLKEKYDARVESSDGEQARFELHTEGDGRAFPSLYLRRVTQEDVLPVMLIANAIGMVRALEDAQTGDEGTYLCLTDSAGRDELPIRLGKDVMDAANSVDAITFAMLELHVKSELTKSFRHKVERAALYEKVRATVTVVTAARSNPTDPVRQAYNAADRKAEVVLGLAQ